MDREDKDLRPRDVMLCEGNAGEKLSPVQAAGKKRQKRQQQQEAGSTDGISPALNSWIRQCCEELKIRKADRSWAAEVVNDFRDNLLKFLKSNTDQPFFQSAEFLTTGSYFENVKIHSPDEFDMMLALQAPAPLAMKMLDNGLFYRLDLKRPTRSPIKAFLLENELTISSSQIMAEMYRLVRKFLTTYKVPDARCYWKVNRKRVYSPAVTLSLYGTNSESDELISVDLVPALRVCPNQGWPQAVRSGPNVDKWLGKKGRQEIMNLPCVFVPKRLKGRNVAEDAKESWRISFSLIEKMIITKHGNKKTCCEAKTKKCCRKQCLMLLKSLIKGLKQVFPKELENLCSYHGKTVFLHTLANRCDDDMWSPKQLPICFLSLLEDLETYACKGSLPHFFVPDCNLFSLSDFPRKSLCALVSALKQQRMEGLPLLRPPAPVPPLGLSPPVSTVHSTLCQTAAYFYHLSFKAIRVLLLVTLFILIYYYYL